MIEKILVLPDVHLTQDSYSNYYGMVKNFMRDFKPHETIILGDFMNCDSLSHWNENNKKELEDKRYQKECDFANQELDYIQRYSRRVVYLEGNHEYWVYQYLEKNPNLIGSLEIPKKLFLMNRQ